MYFGADQSSIVDHNAPPTGQPGITDGHEEGGGREVFYTRRHTTPWQREISHWKGGGVAAAAVAGAGGAQRFTLGPTSSTTPQRNTIRCPPPKEACEKGTNLNYCGEHTPPARLPTTTTPYQQHIARPSNGTMMLPVAAAVCTD